MGLLLWEARDIGDARMTSWHASRSRITAKFQQYRQEQLFVDLRYSIDNEIHSAHKLILARHSGFFHELFKQLPPPAHCTTPLDLAIPFDPFGTFSSFVDFLYSGDLRFEDTDYESIIGLYAIAAFYDAPDLAAIMATIVRSALERIDSPPAVYKLTRAYCRFDPVVTVPGSEALVARGRSAVRDSQGIFVAFLARHFDVLRESRTDLFRSLSAHLLSRVMIECRMPNLEIGDLAEGHIRANCTTDPADFAAFESAVDWAEERVFLLFSRFEMRWANAATSRGLISRVIDQRRTTLSALESEIEHCRGDVLNRWFAFSWLQTVRDSTGATVQQPIKLIRFLSTLAGVASPCNPVAFRFIDDDCGPSLGGEGLDSRVLFDYSIRTTDTRWSYVSAESEKHIDSGAQSQRRGRKSKKKRAKPVDVPAKDVDKFIGVKAVGFAFDLSGVTFEYHPKVERVYRLPQRLDLVAAFNDVEVVALSQKEVRDGIATFMLDGNALVTGVRVVMRPQKLHNGSLSILRADTLRVFGTFAAEAQPIARTEDES